MKSIRTFGVLLACLSVAGLWGCESVSDLDEVKMAAPDQDAGTTETGAEAEAETASDVSADPQDEPSPDAAETDTTVGQDSSQSHDAFEASVDAPTAQDAADALDDGTLPPTEAGDGGPLWFPETCVKPGSVQVQCNPMTNAGCASGTACDMAENAGKYAFVCFPDGTIALDGACNGVSGPWCKATLHCGTTTCTKFCCTSDDCDGPTPQCGMYDPGKVGTFGWCM